jgi:hypothetical protein
MGSSRCSTAHTWTSTPVRPDRRSQDGTHRTRTRHQGVAARQPKLSHLPPRLITGAYIVNAGVSKLGAGEETAKGLHGIAAAAYPFLGKLDAQTFTRLLGAGELTLGASLLLPIVPTALAGLGLAGFSAGLLGLYLRIPGMRQNAHGGSGAAILSGPAVGLEPANHHHAAAPAGGWAACPAWFARPPRHGTPARPRLWLKGGR